jgi:tRNA 2-thiouridine synthesizing protein A
MADQVLDTKGLTCPMPVLKAKKALNEMAGGTTLEILATDPAAKEDFEVFCRSTGHELLEFSEDCNVQTFLIRRKA